MVESQRVLIEIESFLHFLRTVAHTALRTVFAAFFFKKFKV